MTNEYTPALEEQFNKDCTVINLKYEYPGFTGTEQYAIMTDLSPKELEDYGELLAQYEPYLILGTCFAEARDEFRRNEKKHEMRALRGSIFSIDDDFEEHHPEVAERFDDDEHFEREMLQMAIRQLPEEQRRRIRAFYFDGYNARQIAKMEGVSSQAVDKSIAKGEKNIKKFLQGVGICPFPVGTSEGTCS